jgi:non-specific serine/threonine protein kinase
MTDSQEIDSTAAKAHALLGHARFNAAWARGRASGLDDLIKEVRRSPEPDVSTMTSTRLTRREQEVARLLARGYSNREIAGALVIALSTAERHVANILDKLNLRTRVEIAVWAADMGLTEGLPDKR